MPERKPIIAGNWKMHHDHFTAIQYTQKLSYALDKSPVRRPGASGSSAHSANR